VRGSLFSLLVATWPVWGPASAQDRNLTEEERVELIRGLTAEYATAKTGLPRSKDPLPLNSQGTFDQKRWTAAGRENGLAAKSGDLVQITKVTLEDKRIVLEINGGMSGGRKWYQRIEVGTSQRTIPLDSGSQSVAVAGTNLALVFPGRLPPVKSAEVKKLLAPVLDFTRRSASETYIETLPPEIQEAVKQKKAVEGMKRDQVLLALGQPVNKVRTTVDGTEYEDWIYGSPPGRIVFVTFDGDEVVRVKESYAGLGGSVAAPLPFPR
jgi:hypothetical protein